MANLWCSSRPEPPHVGRDLQQFEKMIDTARTNPDISAMIPGRMAPSEKGTWQYEVQKAVFERQTVFACGLDGKHGGRGLMEAYREDHFCLMRNQRTFGGALQDSTPSRMNVWVGEGHGGALANLYYVGAPVSISFLSNNFVPMLQRGFENRNVTYDCVAILILPKWDMGKQEFIPDTWQQAGDAPDDIENRYALSFTFCNCMGTRDKDYTNNKNGRNGTKGSTVYVPFYEVHGNKFSRDKSGKLQAHHVLLSEYDDLYQEKDVNGEALPTPDTNMRIAFKTFVEQNNIKCFDKPENFDQGIQQYKEQFELATGMQCDENNSSLVAPYL